MSERPANMDALQALTTRASPQALVAPAPDAATLERLFQAAIRAPDHGRLRPWRFMIIEGAARETFGDVLASALRRREPQVPEAALVKERAKPLRAPLIVVVAARVREHRGVPEVEQVVAAGAAAQNLLLAAHALGFGGFWRTGAAAYDDSVKRALGLSRQDAIVGFVYLGTPSGVPASPIASDVAPYVSHWTGPVSRPEEVDR
ncbi:MAG TPA: nitroreductase family protein [Casimicrobiaceae bacterium]